MLKKEDKDGIIVHLKNALIDVQSKLADITLDPEQDYIDERTINEINDKIDHVLRDVIW